MTAPPTSLDAVGLPNPIEELREAVARDPTDVHARTDLGAALVVQGALDEAVEHLRVAIALDASSVFAHRNLGAAFLQLGAVDRALEHLRTAVSLDPNDPSAQCGLGSALFEQSAFDEAIEHLRAAVSLEPNYGFAHCKLAIVLLEQGAFDEAIEHLRVAISVDPNYGVAHSNLGAALVRLGAFDEGVEHLRSALALDPSSAHAHVNVAVGLLRAGQRREAITLLHKALALDPRFLAAYGAMAEAMISEGAFAAAIEHLRTALTLAPDYARAHEMLGDTLLRVGALAEAIEHFRTAVTLNPKDADAHIDLGEALTRNDAPDGAIEHFRTAVKLDPGSELAHCNLGTALAEEGALPEAKQHLYTAIELEPRSALAQHNLGLLLYREGAIEEATQHLRTSLAIDPNLARAHLTFSLIHWNQRNNHLAAAHAHRACWLHFSRALDLATLSSGNLLHLARVLTTTLDSPLMALRVMESLPNLWESTTWTDTYLRTAARCSQTESTLAGLAADPALDELEKHWLQAVLKFYLGDPGFAFEQLDRAEENAGDSATESIALQYYLLRSADAILHQEASSIREYAIGAALRATTNSRSDADDLYYAALLLLEHASSAGDALADQRDEPTPTLARALECLERCLAAVPEHLPARYLHAQCLLRQPSADDSASLQSLLELLRCERRALAAGTGFVHGLTPIHLELDPASWQKGIRRMAHAHEIADATQEVLGAIATCIEAPRAETSNLAAEIKSEAQFLDLRKDWELVHAADVFRAERSLTEWFERDTDRRAARAAQTLAVRETGSLDDAFKRGVRVEELLGREIYERRARDPAETRDRIRYALLNRYLTPEAAVALQCYAIVIGSPADRTKKAFRAAMLNAAATAVAAPFQSISVVALSNILAAALSEFVKDRFTKGETVDAYASFREGFMRWLTTQRQVLGAESFDKRFPFTQWLEAPPP